MNAVELARTPSLDRIDMSNVGGREVQPGLVMMTIFLPIAESIYEEFLDYVDSAGTAFYLVESERMEFLEGLARFVELLADAQTAARKTIGEEWYAVISEIDVVSDTVLRWTTTDFSDPLAPRQQAKEIRLPKAILEVPYQTPSVGNALMQFLKSVEFGRMESVYTRPLTPKERSEAQ